MKEIAEDIKKLYLNEKLALALIVLNFIASVALFVFSITVLSPEGTIVKTGYGDIGGYRDGSWAELLAFPILAAIYGVFHSIIAVRIFHERGAGMVKFFTLITALLIVGTFIVLNRVVGRM